MPRRPKPWFKKSHQAWYTKIKGKMVRLASTEEEAWREFHLLMASQGPRPRPVGRITVGDLLESWLRVKANEVKPKTLEIARTYTQSFADHVRDMRASDVTTLTIYAWLNAHPNWSKATRGIAVTNVKAAYRWATFEEMIPRNPIERVKAPTSDPRPPANVDVVEKILAEVSPAARELFAFLVTTGCRPGEGIGLEASRLDFPRGAATVFGKRGEREVVLPEALIPSLRKLAEARPYGLLFRNQWGNRWTVEALRCQIRRARKRLGIEESFCPYHLRGIFASRRIAAGVDSSLVGKMLGHQTPYILHKHYHNAELATLREAVEAKPPRNKKARPKSGG